MTAQQIILSSKILILILVFSSCNSEQKPERVFEERIELSLDMANSLMDLPLSCVYQKYPYKLGQVLGEKEELQEPEVLHPAFYGCFDWHSAVHGHWSIVKLLKDFPNLERAQEARDALTKNLSKENIQTEVSYFDARHNKSFERTYGWAWLLKLAEELHKWDDPLARELENNLQPLTDLIVQGYIDFLPNLIYPIRVGEHSNTAFGLSFAWDYANAVGNKELKESIETRAKDFYLTDNNCPIKWEPSGYDFLSPCLEEVDIMRRVLSPEEFGTWFNSFLPDLIANSNLEPGKVSDRTDGKLVHLDGLNFSRAWVLYGLANQYPEFEYLNNLGNEHIKYSLPNLFSDSYEGGHWLGSFAIYALSEDSN